MVCKHILFVFSFVLNGDAVLDSVTERYIEDKNLRNLFSASPKEVSPEYLQPKTSKNNTMLTQEKVISIGLTIFPADVSG